MLCDRARACADSVACMFQSARRRMGSLLVSVVDLVVNVEKKGLSAEDVNAAFRTAAAGPLNPLPPAYYAHLAAYRARYYVEGLFSDNGSQTAGRAATREQEIQLAPQPAIKGIVKERMFYC